MTTPQNPYGPQARPAQPYNSHPQHGPQGSWSGPASGPQAAWTATPQQQYGGPSAPGHPRHAGPAGHPAQGAGHPAQGYGPAGHTAQGYGPPSGPQYGAPAGTGRPQRDDDPGRRSGGQPLPQYPSGNGRPTPPAQPPRNGFGTTALVLGILGAVFALIPVIGVIAWPLVILGLIFGILGIARTRSGKADNKGVAISGTVLSAIGLILCIVWAAAFSSAVSSVTPPTGATSPTGGTSAGGGSQAGATFPGSTSGDIVGNAGETLTVGDMQVSATALKPGDSTLGATLCTTVNYTNTGTTPAQFSGIGDWKLQDPAGAALMTGFTGTDKLLSTGELTPGGTTSGEVCFDRSSSASGQFVLLYQPMMSFSSDRGAWLNQVG